MSSTHPSQPQLTRMNISLTLRPETVYKYGRIYTRFISLACQSNSHRKKFSTGYDDHLAGRCDEADHILLASHFHHDYIIDTHRFLILIVSHFSDGRRGLEGRRISSPTESDWRVICGVKQWRTNDELSHFLRRFTRLSSRSQSFYRTSHAVG